MSYWKAMIYQLFAFFPLPGVPNVAKAPMVEAASKNKMANFFRENFDML